MLACAHRVCVCECVCISSAAKAKHGCLLTGSQDDPEDQSSLIVAIVIGLLLVAGIVGLGYWCYMKNSRYRKRTLAFWALAFVAPAAGAAPSLEMYPQSKFLL